jgi:hypothetical protein
MWEMSGEEEALNPDFKIQFSVVSDFRLKQPVKWLIG